MEFDTPRECGPSQIFRRHVGGERQVLFDSRLRMPSLDAARYKIGADHLQQLCVPAGAA